MDSVIARRATNVPPDRPRIWLYWDGKDWTQDVTKAVRYKDRQHAFVHHEKLVGKKDKDGKLVDWPSGGSPVVVERP